MPGIIVGKHYVIHMPYNFLTWWVLPDEDVQRQEAAEQIKANILFQYVLLRITQYNASPYLILTS